MSSLDGQLREGATPLDARGRALAALLTAQQRLEALATSPGPLSAIVEARRHRDAQAWRLIELGFDVGVVNQLCAGRD